MKKTEQDEKIPLLKPHTWNSYRPEDVKRWGIKRFLSEVSPQYPIPVPDLGFTVEEDQRMDEILKEDQARNDL